MDRVIKFRAWDKQKKQWLVWEHIISMNLLRRIFTDDRFVPYQYIEIKDKNKQEIYEGDICIYTNQKGQHIGQVKFLKTLNAFRLVFVEREEFFFISDDNEIIGNIHENPELLEKK